MAIHIVIPRGDSYSRGMVLRNPEKQPVLTEWDDIYFTAKENFKNRNYVFQKRMSTGGIVNNGSGRYTLTIDPEDTDKLNFTTYDIDFEFVKGNIKKTFSGTLEITKEVTHAYNE